MSNTPLYRSIRASFSKDIYMPICPIVAAPSVTFEIKSREKSDAALKYIFRHDAVRENISGFPAASSLARKIKQYVTDGGVLYEAFGEIQRDKI